MKKNIYITFIVFYLVSCANNSESKQNKDITINTKMDSISYGMGVNLGTAYKNQEFDIDTDLFHSGFIQSYNGENVLISDSETQKMLRDYYMEVRMEKSERQKLLSEENKIKSEKFLEENKLKSDIIELESGLQYKILKSGSGSSPNINETVLVHYTGKTMDGTIFDSSRERDEPAEFSLRSVIKGWTEALQLMKTGDNWEIYIPPKLGYGRRGSGGKIGPNEVLIFDVELVKIIKN